MKRTNSEIITNNSILNQGQLVVAGNGRMMEGVAEGRRTQDVDALAIVRDLFERHFDLFHHFLYSTDMGTLLNFRRVSKAICELSMSLGGGLSPLMCRAFIAFSINQLMDELEKWAFARERTGIHVSEINVNHLRNPGLLCDNIDFTKAQVSLGFQVKSNDELKEFSELLLSDELSEKQKLILGKIRELEFEKWIRYKPHYDVVPEFRLPIDNNNIAEINTVLSFFGAKERAAQLTTLKFGNILVKLTLQDLPSLTVLEFVSIDAEVTLSNLPNLTRLTIASGVSAALTLHELSNLQSFEVGILITALTLRELPSLTTLSFRDIIAPVTLSKLRSLTTLSCGSIGAALKLSELPSLTMFQLKDVDISNLSSPAESAKLCNHVDIAMAQMSIIFTVCDGRELTEFSELLLSNGLSEEQKLILGMIKELRFYKYIRSIAIDKENIAQINTVLNYFGSTERASQLEKLSFKNVGAALALPELPNLTTLEFGDINDVITLPMLGSLTTFSVRHVNAEIWLPDLPNLEEFLAVGDIAPMLMYYG